MQTIDTNTIRHVPMSEAARILGVKQQTLWQYHKDGKLTAVKAGWSLLVDPEQARQELLELGYYHRKAVREKRQQHSEE